MPCPRLSSVAGGALAASFVAALAAPACSLMFDPDDLPLGGDAGPPDVDGDGVDATPDATTDATPDASPDATSSDAGPAMAIAPGQVFEGQGSSGPPIPIALVGPDFDPSIDLDVASSDEDLVALVDDSAVVSEDGSIAGAEIRIAAGSIGAGDERVVDIVASQNGIDYAAELTIVGLDALTLTGDSTIDESMFDARYSTITIEGSPNLAGLEVAPRFRATGTIHIAGVGLDARGGAGDESDAGPGGCKGGGGEGACGAAGGGEASDSRLGGGGAGHAEAGSAADGDGGGEGGEEAGTRFLTPLPGDPGVADPSEISRGHGGGAAGETSPEVGRGGHGGGALELSTDGDLVINGAIRADGGAGTAGNVDLFDCSGGGGGGSGGAVILRVGGELRGEEGAILAPGGTGGDGEIGATCTVSDNDGGDGAPGRIRIDAPAADLPPAEDLAIDPAPIRGPMFKGAPPTLVRSESITIEFVATRDEDILRYGITVNDEPGQDAAPDGEGIGELTAEGLVPGENEICLLAPVLSGLDDLPQAKNCRNVVYIPGD